MSETGPSERAVEAASWGEVFEAGRIGPNNAETILSLAHDPKLGLDRSVCLRDVVEALRSSVAANAGPLADLIERQFTEEAGSDG